MKRIAVLFASSLAFACSANDGTTDAASTPSAEEPTNQAAAQAQEAPTHTYTIELGGKHRVTYSSFADGALIVSEQGDAAADRPVGESVGMLSPVEAFQKLRPGVAVPAELSAMQVVQDAAEEETVDEAAPAPRVEAPEVKGLIPKIVTSDPATFFDSFGCFFGSGDVLAACAPNRGEWANATGTSRWAIYKVAPYLGDVTVRISIAGTVRAIYPVFQGNFHWNWARGGLVRHSKRVIFDGTYFKEYPNTTAHQFEIVDAAGDQFHLSVRLHNYQFGGPNCAEVSSSDTSFWVKEGTAADCAHNHYQ